MEIKLIEVFDDADVLGKLENLEKVLAGIEQEAASTGQVLSESLRKSDEAANALSLALQQSAVRLGEQAQATASNQKNLSAWRAALNQTIMGTQIAGRSVGEWKESLGALSGSMRSATGTTTAMTGAARIFNTVLKASPIGIIIAAVISLIAYFSKFQGAVDILSAVMAGFNAVLDEITDRVATVGAAVAKFLTGDFEGGMNDLKDAASGLGGALLEAAESAYNLERRLQALRDAQIKASVSFAASRAEIERLRAEADRDGVSTQKRLSLLQEASRIEAGILQKRAELARENRDINVEKYEQERLKLEDLIRSEASAEEIATQRRKLERERFAASVEDRQAVADAEIALIEAETEINTQRIESEEKIKAVRKKAAEERKKQLEEEKKLLEEVSAALAKLNAEVAPAGIESDLAAVNKKYDDLLILSEKALEKLNKIQKRRALTPAELSQVDRLLELRNEIEAKRLSELLDVATEYAEKDIQVAEKVLEGKRKLEEADRQRVIDALKFRKDQADREIELAEVQASVVVKRLQSQGAAEQKVQEAQEQFAEEFQARRLQNAIDFNKELLLIEINPERRSEILKELQILEAQLAALDVEGKKKKRKPLTIWELLGVENPDIQDGIKAAANQVISAIEQVTEAAEKAADRRVEAVDKEVQALEDRLKAEIEAGEKGNANNRALIESELSAKRNAQQKALAEQAKARRASAALETAQQAASLITAASNIFASLSSIKIIGIPLAIGLISTMFGAFVTAKVRANQLAQAPKLRKGKRIEGRSHEQGGEEHYGVDGRRYEVEAKEWVIGTEPSREHDSFLAKLNAGKYRGIDLERALANSDSYTPPLGHGTSKRIEREREKTVSAQESRQERAMKAAYMAAAQMTVEAIERRPVVYPAGDYVVEYKEGNKRVKKRVKKARLDS